MTSPKEHTPGPWRTVLGDYGSLPMNHYLAIYGGDESCVAHALALKQHWEKGDEHPVEANARLIAAAPDLLAALKELVGEAEPGEMFSKRIERAVAAIRKATGES